VDDGDYSTREVATRTRADLGNNLGNLVMRSTSSAILGALSSASVIHAPKDVAQLLHADAASTTLILNTLPSLHGACEAIELCQARVAGSRAGT